MASRPYDPQDHYFRKAKQENFLARSVYKLEEIDQRFKVLGRGWQVLDLGASPGSWSQYAAQKVGPEGRVLGVDLQPMRCAAPNFLDLEADVFTLDYMKVLPELGLRFPLDVVLSDMAPGTTGIRVTDQARSFDLCMRALEVARRTLRLGGNFVVKFFDSSEFPNLRREIQASFQKVEVLRPKSTRTSSKEVFLIGLNFKGYLPSPETNDPASHGPLTDYPYLPG